MRTPILSTCSLCFCCVSKTSGALPKPVDRGTNVTPLCFSFKGYPANRGTSEHQGGAQFCTVKAHPYQMMDGAAHPREREREQGVNPYTITLAKERETSLVHEIPCVPPTDRRPKRGHALKNGERTRERERGDGL